MSKLSLDEIFKKLADKLDVAVEEINTDYQKIVEEVKADERFVNAGDNEVLQIARNRLIARKRRELISPAIPWEGMVLGVGNLVDTVARQRSMTEEMFKLNSEKALAGCWVEDRGKKRMIKAAMVTDTKTGEEKMVSVYPPTENNKKWKRADKPLPEHSWLRNIYGIAVPIDKKTKERGGPRPFQMVCNGKKAVDMKIPLFKKVTFKGINKTTKEDLEIYRINFSTFTKFEVDKTLKIPDTEDLLPSMVERYRTLAELDEYHDKNKTDYNRWMVTEGTVSILNLEPNTKTQNMRMVLDDESLLFSGNEGQLGVTCWIPTDRGIVIDFAQDSRIYVVGQTNQGKARDPITGENTDEPGDIMINVYGIYCPELFKVKQEPEELTEKSLEIVTGSGGIKEVDKKTIDKPDIIDLDESTKEATETPGTNAEDFSGEW